MLILSILTVVLLVAYGLFYFFFLPTLSIFYFEGAFFIGLGILFTVTIFFAWASYYSDPNSYKNKILILLKTFIVSLGFIVGYSAVLIFLGTNLFSFIISIIFLVALFGILGFFIFITPSEQDDNDTHDLAWFAPISIKVCAIVILILLTLGLIASSSVFHANTMYNQLGKPEEKSFKDDLVEIDNSQIPIVDIELADILGDKKLGEELALGSQAHVGTFTNKQSVNGKLLYVAPLEHSGIFKWLSNTEGTTGYISISATNPNDVKLVSDVKLKFIPSAYLGDDLIRHLRFCGFISEGFSEPNFELDDSGKPFWVVTTYRNATFWSCPEATGVVLCDPQSGECTSYSLDDVPSWIDIVQPEEFVINQIKNYGEYVHGVFNFSDKDKLTMTEHITTVYNDGNCYYYTGLSSSGSDNSTVGFIMVNARSKSSKLYRMVGATEAAAMSSAEGKLQDMEYLSTTPIPLNISGVPTYFSTLKDVEGLIKAYAMVNIEDYSIVATGSSILEARRAYINAVNNAGKNIDFSGKNSGSTELTGVISRIGSNNESGNTYYYLILNNDMSKLYLASYSISEELPISIVGDRVTVSYTDDSGTSINLVQFDNLDVK